MAHCITGKAAKPSHYMPSIVGILSPPYSSPPQTSQQCSISFKHVLSPSRGTQYHLLRDGEEGESQSMRSQPSPTRRSRNARRGGPGAAQWSLEESLSVAPACVPRLKRPELA